MTKLETLAKSIALPGGNVRGMNAPSEFTFSACGKLLVFLDVASDGSQYLACLDVDTLERRDLFRTDEGDNEDNLSLEEKLRRERMRQYATGITSYIWDGKGKVYMPLQGSMYALDPFCKPAPEVETVLSKVAGEAPRIAFQLSDDRTKLGFVQSNKLYVCTANTMEGASFGPPQLFGAWNEQGEEEGKSCGLASFLAQEEMDRSEGFWFSPGSGKMLAYERVDETKVTKVPIGNETYRYPFAGEVNPTSELCVCSTLASSSKETKIVPLKLHTNGADEEEEIYLAQVAWYTDTQLAVQIMNRLQTTLELQMIDVNTMKVLWFVREQSPHWINLQHSNCTFLPGKDKCQYIWSSEQHNELGLSQLFLYQEDKMLRRITPAQAAFVVDAILSIDIDQSIVYLAGNASHAMDKNVLAVSLAEHNSDEVRMVTDYGTAHSAVFSPQHDLFVLVHSSASEPLTVTLQRTSTHTNNVAKKPRIVEEQTASAFNAQANVYVRNAVTLLNPLFDIGRLPSYCNAPPSQYTFTLKDGTTKLHTQLYIPVAQSGGGPFPTIVYIYGGPHVQRVANNWLATVDLRCQALKKMGFLVMKCDARGSSRRGLKFEAPLKHAMGTVELEDHIEVLEQLSSKGLVDLKRGVGIMGWSYGGYMSALALAKHGNVFKVGVAGAPVTYWQGYDTCYTERYMGLPSDNVEGYLQASVMSHIQVNDETSQQHPFGKLMLIHGMMDENVHFTHSTTLIERLTQCQQPYDLVVLPHERHGPRNAASKLYIETRILEYFSSHL